MGRALGAVAPPGTPSNHAAVSAGTAPSSGFWARLPARPVAPPQAVVNGKPTAGHP